MGDYEFGPSASRRLAAFKRLASQNPGSSRPDSGGKRSPIGSQTGSIFNQVQVARGSPRRDTMPDSSLARLEDAVDDNKTSSFTLYTLSEASREIQESNISASAASVKEVEAAVRLAEELRQRIVGNDGSANEAQAEKLSLAMVERRL